MRRLPYSLGLMLAATLSVGASATPILTVLAETGGDAVGGGTYQQLGVPIQNAAGQVAFAARVDANANLAFRADRLYRAGADGAVAELFRDRREGFADEDVVVSPWLSSISGTGELGFGARVIEDTRFTSSGSSGVFRVGGADGLVEIARSGDVPTGESTDNFTEVGAVRVASDSSAIFFGRTAPGLASFGDTQGYYRAAAGGTPAALISDAETGPSGGAGSLAAREFVTNDAGQIVYAESSGLSRAGDAAGPRTVVAAGDRSPDGNGAFGSVATFDLNSGGTAAFSAFTRDDVPGFETTEGVFASEASGTLRVLARGGDATPDGNGTFDVFRNVSLNDAGQVSFLAESTGTAGFFRDRAGLYVVDVPDVLTDPVAIPRQLARQGDAAAGGDGVFAGFTSIGIGEGGHVAFLASLSSVEGATSNVSALYVYDPFFGLVEALREGDPFAGSVVTGLSLGRLQTEVGGSDASLSADGVVAFRYELADGRTGIAVAVVPEPGAAALLCSGLVVLLGKRGAEPRA